MKSALSFYVVIIFCAFTAGCSPDEPPKYPLGPCAGDLCMGQREAELAFIECSPNKSGVSSAVYVSCELDQAIDLGGNTAVETTVDVLNSSVARALLKFRKDSCRPIRALLTAKFGDPEEKFFPPAGAKPSLENLSFGLEWATTNGRLVLRDGETLSPASPFCMLQIDAEWIGDEVSRALKSNDSVRG